MISAVDLRVGKYFLHDGELMQVLYVQHHRRAMADAVVRVKLKNMKTNSITERTFRPVERFEEPEMRHVKAQYLYRDGGHYVFMNSESYEQIHFSADTLGDAVKFLKDGMEVDFLSLEGQVYGVELPTFVEFEIKHTEQWIKGDTATSTLKPAEIETGATIQVPLFVKTGDRIKIDTRTGDYVERA